MADAAARFVVLEGSEENFLAAATNRKLLEIDAQIPVCECELANMAAAAAYLKKFGYKLDFGREQGLRTMTSMGIPHWVIEKKSSEY